MNRRHLFITGSQPCVSSTGY